MIHVDTRKLVQLQPLGHRITGDRPLGCSRVPGYRKAHMAMDGFTRLAVELTRPRSSAQLDG